LASHHFDRGMRKLACTVAAAMSDMGTLTAENVLLKQQLQHKRLRSLLEIVSCRLYELWLIYEQSAAALVLHLVVQLPAALRSSASVHA
jgi:hypothetical protein